MKCPSCGKEMKPGMLYCENCGNEIHIVPEFETEVEAHIRSNMDSVTDFVQNEAGVAEEQKERKKLLLVGITGILVLVCVLLFVIFGLRSVGVFENNAKNLPEEARNAAQSGKTIDAIELYENCLQEYPDRQDLKLELVELYFIVNDRAHYENLLLELIREPSLTKQQLNSCYGKLIAYYNQEKLEGKIQELLNSCTNQDILEAYSEYYAPEPVFDMQGGYYSQILLIKIQAPKEGAVYYTLDGSRPNENSTKYSIPIVLDQGDHLLKAVYISKSGAESALVSEEYHVMLQMVEPPTVLTVSGNYHERTLIEVDAGDAQIYYTMDKSDPTQDSIPYTGPIEMPYGKSIFKFVTIQDDKKSDIVERTYEFTVPEAYTVELAHDRLLTALIDAGRICDEYGSAWSEEYHFEYRYLTSVYIREKIYFVYAEICAYNDSTEVTEGFYGVNIMDGSVVTVKQDENFSYYIAET